MLETAFKSSVDVARAKMAASDVELNVDSRVVPLYDSFETQHLGKYAFRKRYSVFRKMMKIRFFTRVRRSTKCARYWTMAWPACSARRPATRHRSCSRFAITKKYRTYKPGGTSIRKEDRARSTCTHIRARWPKWALYDGHSRRLVESHV